MTSGEPAQRPSAPLAPHRPLTEFYHAPSERPQFVNDLFDRAAPDYEWMSQALSFGTDRGYRSRALKVAGLKPGMKALDVATGTGLVARAALEIGLSRRDVIGLDPSRGMLAENRRTTGIHLIQGRGERLPLFSECFDFVSMGYALRHVEDLTGLFQEFHRILKPRGKVLILEISRPRSRAAFRLMSFYLHRVLPWLIRRRGRKAESARLMEYYWATIAECVPPEVILDAMTAAGFECTHRSMGFGLLNDYAGVRRP